MGIQETGSQIGFPAACLETDQTLVVGHLGHQNPVDGIGFEDPACQSLAVGCYLVGALMDDFTLVQNFVVALAVHLALKVVVL